MTRVQTSFSSLDRLKNILHVFFFGGGDGVFSTRQPLCHRCNIQTYHDSIAISIFRRASLLFLPDQISTSKPSILCQITLIFTSATVWVRLQSEWFSERFNLDLFKSPASFLSELLSCVSYRNVGTIIRGLRINCLGSLIFMCSVINVGVQ